MDRALVVERAPAIGQAGVRVRDDFSDKVRKAVALRAGYRCSFPECVNPTVGPSDESSMAVANVGEAAHICAAAPGPGARRYKESMTSEERSSIENAIWLCVGHSRLIDRDEVTYTEQIIRSWKRDHEQKMKLALARGSLPDSAPENIDLIALGPDIVGVGEFIGSSGPKWKIRLQHFIVGDTGALVRFGESFNELSANDRYVLLNVQGDGRVLSSAPAWSRRDGGIELELEVQRRFPRALASDMGGDLMLGDDGDLVVVDGDFGIVSGVERVPQNIQLVLSMQRGEVFYAKEFGSRISEYLALYSGSPWLDSFLKMEVIRLACVPFYDSMTKSEYTQLSCVDRVVSVRALRQAAENNLLPVELELDIAGMGRLKREFKIYVSDYPPKPPPEPPRIPGPRVL